MYENILTPYEAAPTHRPLTPYEAAPTQRPEVQQMHQERL